MAAPTVDDLAEFMGRESLDWDQAGAVLGIVTALARSYTRGRGFDDEGLPADDVRAAILTAAARLLADPTGIVEQERYGPISTTYQDHSAAWSAGELAVLHRYRLRAL